MDNPLKMIITMHNISSYLQRWCSRLNNAPFKIHVHPEAQNVTLFENGDFADVIN